MIKEFEVGKNYKHRNMRDIEMYVSGIDRPTTTDVVDLVVCYWHPHYNGFIGDIDWVKVKRDDFESWFVV